MKTDITKECSESKGQIFHQDILIGSSLNGDLLIDHKDYEMEHIVTEFESPQKGRITQARIIKVDTIAPV